MKRTAHSFTHTHTHILALTHSLTTHTHPHSHTYISYIQPILNGYFSFLIQNDHKYLNELEAVEYLHSKENDVIFSRKPAFQNMNQPLPAYFIASSHNTYLQGKQMMDISSLDAYARALRQGARCVELDCWDGEKGPVITHGGAFCTKINFRDAIEVINEYAFVTSQYPLILSIENHCSTPQQDLMADIFIAVLGDKLLTAPVPAGSTLDSVDKHPSPEALKGKIIIKFHKHVSFF